MDFTFYNRADYFTQLTAGVQAAGQGSRIALATMTFSVDEPLVLTLFEAMKQAVRRGATVSLSVDARNFLHDDKTKLPGPLWWDTDMSQRFHGQFKAKYAALQSLKAAGITVGITNVPAKRFSNRHGGRSHIKGAVIDNNLYIGGCNLGKANDIDIMCGWQAPADADWLYGHFRTLAETGSTAAAFKGQDLTQAVDAYTTLLIDAGVPRQSIILNTALQLIDNTRKSLFFTCQFFPGGKTGQHLLHAYQRGADIDIVFNTAGKHGLQAPGHFVYELLERLRLPRRFFADKLDNGFEYLHAKVLCSETEAMVGSHNYVMPGVNWGTAEIALHVKDPQFAQRLREFTESEILNS